jgi:hypothetical protein
MGPSFCCKEEEEEEEEEDPFFSVDVPSKKKVRNRTHSSSSLQNRNMKAEDARENKNAGETQDTTTA